MQIDYLEPAAGEYRPGACNIGPREIAKRRAYGVAGIVATVVLGVALVAIDAPQIARAIVLSISTSVARAWVWLASLLRWTSARSDSSVPNARNTAPAPAQPATR